jgi:pimeloyl-ACP methyl ester carboxylesterase
MDLQTFERKRLQLFRDNGFAGESQRVTDRDGRSTYLIGRGEGQRPTILLHGGLSEASIWCLLAERIPGRVIIPDRPGCGLSYRIDYRGLDYRMAAADWLLDLADGLDADQVDLVASSMGGFFAMAFATRHPERVRRLVLTGAPAGLDTELPLFPRLWGNPIIGSVIGKLAAKTKSPEDLRKRVFPLLVAHPESLSLEFLEIGLAALNLPGAGVAAHTMLRSVTTMRGWRRQLMMRDDLAKLPVPTLFVWGDKDAFAPPSSGEDMVARMANAEIEIIEDVGHLPFLDQPATIAAIINPFLAS